MTDEKKRATALLTAIHCEAMHTILDGAELVTDGPCCAAVYLARCARIMSTLRVRGLTSREEIEHLAEQFTLNALDDSLAGMAKDAHGREILAATDKAKVH